MHTIGFLIAIIILPILAFFVVYSFAVTLLFFASLAGNTWLPQIITYDNYLDGMVVAAIVCYARYVFALVKSVRYHSGTIRRIVLTCWTCAWLSWAYVAAVAWLQCAECLDFVAFLHRSRNKTGNDDVINNKQ